MQDACNRSVHKLIWHVSSSLVHQALGPLLISSVVLLMFLPQWLHVNLSFTRLATLLTAVFLLLPTVVLSVGMGICSRRQWNHPAVIQLKPRML